MPRVDFYILKNGNSVEQFACSITNKALKSGKRIHINTQNEADTAMLDDLLWTFRDISFLPHEIYQGELTSSTAITLGNGNQFPDVAQVIVNLTDSIPAHIDQYERVIEIVGGSENRKDLARQRYRDYRKMKFEIHDHQIELADS
ncbi:MAG: DNA polymerase III subunit chi [Pseudomonadota bacterium]